MSIGNKKYKYHIRRTKGANPHTVGWNTPIKDIRRIINRDNPFLVVLEQQGKRNKKVYEAYNGNIILNKLTDNDTTK